MTPEQRAKVDDLIRCTFLPGSYQKRFVHDLYARRNDENALTENQAQYLDKLHHMYRRQIERLHS
jgi:hypothetical protein